MIPGTTDSCVSGVSGVVPTPANGPVRELQTTLMHASLECLRQHKSSKDYLINTFGDPAKAAAFCSWLLDKLPASPSTRYHVHNLLPEVTESEMGGQAWE